MLGAPGGFSGIRSLAPIFENTDQFVGDPALALNDRWAAMFGTRGPGRRSTYDGKTAAVDREKFLLVERRYHRHRELGKLQSYEPIVCHQP